MRRLDRWGAPGRLRYWSIAATRMGDGWLWYALGIILLVYGGPERFLAVGASGAAAVVGIFVFKTLKNLSHRPRPCQLEPHCWSKVLPPDRFSFPSGHTMTAFSTAVAVRSFYPSLAATPSFLPTTTALSPIA